MQPYSERRTEIETLTLQKRRFRRTVRHRRTERPDLDMVEQELFADVFLTTTEDKIVVPKTWWDAFKKQHLPFLEYNTTTYTITTTHKFPYIKRDEEFIHVRIQPDPA